MAITITSETKKGINNTLLMTTSKFHSTHGNFKTNNTIWLMLPVYDNRVQKKLCRVTRPLLLWKEAAMPDYVLVKINCVAWTNYGSHFKKGASSNGPMVLTCVWLRMGLFCIARPFFSVQRLPIGSNAPAGKGFVDFTIERFYWPTTTGLVNIGWPGLLHN